MKQEFSLVGEPFQNYTDFDEFEWSALELEEAGPAGGGQRIFELMGEISRSNPDYVRWVQQALNQAMGLRLAVDGDRGPQTRSAIRSFQQRQGLKVDGAVGPQTEQALVTVTGTRPPTTSGAPASSGPSLSINTPLPESGPGFRAYQRNQARRYGLPETIQALQSIAAAWQVAHPGGPRIEIGDLSFQGGGPMPPHKSHQRGVDIDIRLIRNDGREGGTTFRAANYSRSLTQELVNLIRANGLLTVKYIFFNDPGVRGVTDQSGHDNHLHVRFCSPGETGCRPLMQREMSWEGETSRWNFDHNSQAGSERESELGDGSRPGCQESGKRAKALVERGQELNRRTFARRRGTLGNRIHAAMDVPGPMGALVYTPLAGQVIFSGRISGYGDIVILLHRQPPATNAAGAGSLTTAYGHLQQRLVNVGDCVTAGQAIGKMGNSTADARGNRGGLPQNMGVHLHFSVHRVNGDPNRPRYRDRVGVPQSQVFADRTPQEIGRLLSSHYEEDWTRQVRPDQWLTELGIRIAAANVTQPPQASRAAARPR